jgi:ElaB/YqjD/DUF883 family membrane-anchored ribosome-binding protein
MTQYDPDTGSGSTTEQVKQQVREQAQVAQERAQDARQQARGRLRDQVDQRSTQAGRRLAGSAADARSVAEELRRQGKDTPANMAEQLAGRADRAAEYLKGASGERILRDVEDLTRRNPWAVAAGGLVVGFVASRFLKASSSRRYHETEVSYREPPSGVGRYPVAEPAAEVPVVGSYDPATPTAVADAPVDDRGLTEPDLRPPRAE